MHLKYEKEKRKENILWWLYAGLLVFILGLLHSLIF